LVFTKEGENMKPQRTQRERDRVNDIKVEEQE